MGYLVYLKNRDVPVRVEADVVEEKGKMGDVLEPARYVFLKDGNEVAQFVRADVAYVRREDAPGQWP